MVHAPTENLGGRFRQEFRRYISPEFVPSNHGDIPKPIKQMPVTNKLDYEKGYAPHLLNLLDLVLNLHIEILFVI